MHTVKYSSFFFVILFSQIVLPHGFAGNTLIQGPNQQTWHINCLTKHIENKEKIYVRSYDENNQEWISQKIKYAGFSQTDYFCHLEFNHNPERFVQCTPLQLFYRIADRTWIAAHKLKIGDKLLCANNKTVTISDVTLFNQKIDVYTLEIKNTHIFLVTKDSIVAHNMLIPCGSAATIFALPAEIGCGATIGSALGPVGVCAGVIAGGIIGTIIHTCIKERLIEYGICYGSSEIVKFENFSKKEVQNGNNNAQAPGKPTENDGFVPKKNWDGKKVRHPRGFGWPDNNGSIWIPSGPNGHGCPHWDVEHPDGSYDNVVPGGRIRGTNEFYN